MEAPLLSRSWIDIVPGIKAAILVAVAMLGVGALVVATPSLPARAQSACDAPDLGFGAGEGKNAAELPPTVGTLRIGMLFVDFSDSSATVDPQSIYDAQIPRLVDWYRTVSYGRLTIEVKPLLRWLRLPRTLAEYQENRYEGMIEATVASADPDFDFSSVQALYLVPVMPSLASTVIDEIPIRADSGTIHSWAWIATGSQQRQPNVAIHQTGHIHGLPDLYNARITSTQHKWDVMTSYPDGGGVFAWHRWKLGWLDSNQIVCVTRGGTTSVTLTPLERAGGRKAIVSRVGRQIVVAEVRRREAEDASLCKPGVLVYQVDLNAGAPENVGSRRLPIRLQAAQADDSRRWVRCGPQWRSTYTAGGRASLLNHSVRTLTRLGDGSYRIRLTRGRSHATAQSTPAQQISFDPFDDSIGQHETAVEPDSFSFGNTVVAAFQVGRTRGGGASGIGWATSRDGGSTWTSGTIRGAYSRGTDPAVAYDSAHGVWLISILGLHDGGPELLSSLVTARSTDGLSWSDPVVTSPTLGHFAHDKNWIACDNGPASSFRGRCYVVWTAVSGELTTLGISWSTDGGLTWSPSSLVTSIAGSAWQPVVRPDGTLVIVYIGGRALRATRSNDGGRTFSTPVILSSLQDGPIAGMRAPSLPSAELDARGRITVAWADCRFRSGCGGATTPTDVVYASSNDGVRWSRVRRVPTGRELDSRPHFVVGLGVDGTRLGVAFHALTPDGIVPYFVSSADKGRGWSAPEALAPAQPPTSFPEAGSARFLGDYISTSFVAGGVAVPVFASATAPFDGRYHQGIFATAVPVRASPPVLSGGRVVIQRSGWRVTTSVAVAGLTANLELTCRARGLRPLAKRVTRSLAMCAWRARAGVRASGALVLRTPEADVTRPFVVRVRR